MTTDEMNAALDRLSEYLRVGIMPGVENDGQVGRWQMIAALKALRDAAREKQAAIMCEECEETLATRAKRLDQQVV